MQAYFQSFLDPACMTSVLQPRVSIAAVIVTFEPDPCGLLLQLKALRPQVQHLVVVDNASSAEMGAWSQGYASEVDTLLRMPFNMGIGSAQNRGIDWARAQRATHILLMDQDSIPAPDMVERLLQVLQRYPQAGAAGPFYTDPRQPVQHSPFVWLRGGRFHRLACDDVERIHLVDHLIASGCLIPMDVLNQVGCMREDWFIDFVDVEWSLRTRNAGLDLYGVCGASMAHSLGDSPVVLLGRSFLAHSSWRHYFQVRNALFLYQLPWVSSRWAIASGWRLLLKIGFNCVFGKTRWQHFKMTLRGLWHGVKGRAGPF